MPFELLEIGAVFPLIPAGTSERLDILIRRWRDTRRWCETTDDENEVTAACDLFDTIEQEIAAFPATSFADIAAKLAVASYSLNGAGVLDRYGITPEDNLPIRAKPAWHAASERIVIQAAHDALRLSAASGAGS